MSEYASKFVVASNDQPDADVASEFELIKLFDVVVAEAADEINVDILERPTVDLSFSLCPICSSSDGWMDVDVDADVVDEKML